MQNNKTHGISNSYTDAEYKIIKEYADAVERTPANLTRYALKQLMKRYPVKGVGNN
jgi:hypothetical protein